VCNHSLSLILIYVISGQVSFVIWRKRSLSPWQRDALFFCVRSYSFHKSSPHAPDRVSVVRKTPCDYLSALDLLTAHVFKPSRNCGFKYVGIITSNSECNICSSIGKAC
jgi:hypothetical protein